MKKEIIDGKVAVLYSPGHGAGWSTWGSEFPELVFDPSIVYMVQMMNKEPQNKKQWISNIEAYCEQKYPDFYTGGADCLTISWVPEGTMFRITEYDGYESIEYKEDDLWITA